MSICVPKITRSLWLSLVALIVMTSQASGLAQEPQLKLLFLGDQRGHQPQTRFDIIQPVLAKRGIALTYTEDVAKLNAEALSAFDGLVLYANIDQISADQASALIDYVAAGHAFVPLHCASYCFRNSPDVVALIGAQFHEHGTGVFRVTPESHEHPIANGYDGFTSWDETYVHHLHSEANRNVLEYRYGDLQANGNQREPWTWIKTHGKGRVFYTAWGHDERTWRKRGFHNLVERGIRWACGGDPELAGDYQERPPFELPPATIVPEGLKPFEYAEVGKKIPNYLPKEGWGAQGEPLSTMQLPLDANESLKHYVRPEGFAVKLFAAETELGAKPISMTWDERGRLWVCQTIDYPNAMRPAGEGNDRVTICEDTDGDNVADKFTIFADKLSIPTAIVCYRGGAIVQDGVRTIYLKDTDGDDVADIRKVIIEGWQMGDTHGGVSNFRYGLDNWIWAMQGYNDSVPRFSGGKTGPFHMGFFRFKLDANDPPQVTHLEFIRSTNNNTWGLGISEEGLIFGSTANGNPSVFMPIANRYYESVRGWGPEQLGTIAESDVFFPITEKIRQVDYFGRYTAGAGHALYTARAYPEQWWNRTAFVNGPTGHLVGVFELIADGAGFRSRSPGNILASDDEWSAPIMSEVGPDGNVWTIDWYNYIVQHNPTPNGFKTGKGNAYESELRDKKHGRIVRIEYTGKTSEVTERISPNPKLSIDDPEGLVESLQHSNMLWRTHGQRLLVQRAKTDVVEALVRLVRDSSVDSIGLNPGAIHALWTLHGLGTIGNQKYPSVDEAIVSALSHPSAGVRRNAIQVLPPTSASSQWVLEKGLLNDPEPQVQLAAILALVDFPDSSAVGIALASLAENDLVMSDRWLADAITVAAAKHAGRFLEAFLPSEQKAVERSVQLVERIAEHWARGGDNIDGLLGTIAKSNGQKTSALLSGILAGLPDRSATMSPATEKQITDLAPRIPATELSQLITISNRMGSQALASYAEKVSLSFRETIADPDKSAESRIEAAKRLVALQPEEIETVETILDAIDLQWDPQAAATMVQVLAGCRHEQLSKVVLEATKKWTPNLRKQAIRVLLGRSEWTSELIVGIESGIVTIGELAIDERQTLLNHPLDSVREAAKKLMEAGGGLPSSNRVEVLTKYEASTREKGDPKNGVLLFTEHCSKCHRHGTIGQSVGPDLTGMAVHPKDELLVHILDPNRSVEGNFRAYKIQTVAGALLTGMLAGESKTTVELIDTTGKREMIAREDIEELSPSMLSVMPEGFEQQFDIRAMTDLLEFLTQRGKYLPLDIRKIATLPTDRPMFFGGEAEKMLFDSWEQKEFHGIPFSLIDPADGRVANAMMLRGPNGKVPPTMPEKVTLSVNSSASTIHFLGAVGGWSAKAPDPKGEPVMIVRLRYEDDQVEDHVLRDGIHFADYIGDFNVPGSEKAFGLQRGYQLRYLKIAPDRPRIKISEIDFIKVEHSSCPITMAITLEN